VAFSRKKLELQRLQKAKEMADLNSEAIVLAPD
jgi:hypothetical protein